jgi:hypothetical protein
MIMVMRDPPVFLGHRVLQAREGGERHTDDLVWAVYQLYQSLADRMHIGLRMPLCRVHMV